LAQARLAARNRIALETVLRRYFAGHALLGDFLVEEAERAGIDRAGLRRLLRAQAALFDRLLAAVSEEHRRESAVRIDSSERRKAERVERLLAGESIEAGELGYAFDACHVGLIAEGPGASETIRALADLFDCRLLSHARGDDTVWAWLGSRSRLDPDLLQQALENRPATATVVAIGESSRGLSGWRLTHGQARAALPIARRRAGRMVRYADVALLASMLQDELLRDSLRRLFLIPLDRDGGGGDALRQTLLAYFSSERNVSSTAAALGVTRQTIKNRFRMIEERIGRPLRTCSVEIEVALRLEELDR
jgi:hypothetical protein